MVQIEDEVLTLVVFAGEAGNGRLDYALVGRLFKSGDY